MATTEVPVGQLEEFIQKWSLQEDAQNLLLTMDPANQTKVMNQFAPRDTTRDVNAIFVRFANGVSGGFSARNQGGGIAEAVGDVPAIEVDAFVAQWQLGAEAQAVLSALPASVKHKVMQEFSPRDPSRDNNIIFIRFAQSVAGGKGKGKGKGKGGHFFDGVAPPSQQLRQQLQQLQHLEQQVQQQREQLERSYRQGPALATSVPSGESLEEFITKWNLGTESQELLMNLEPVAQNKAMQEFRPRDATRDVNAIFCRFARGIAENRTRSSFNKPPLNLTGYGQLVAPPAAAGAVAGAGGTLRSYLAKWNLSIEAQQYFITLPPTVQNKIMTEFAPRDATRDVSHIFMKFSQGVARGAEGGGPVPRAGAPRFAPY